VIRSKTLLVVLGLLWLDVAPLGSLRLHAAETPAPSLRQRLKAPRKPNIIFVLADDLGYGDLGSYGQRRIRTPNLDRLAAEGTRFTRCYAGSTVCAPSRAVLMTGRHTGHASIRGNGDLPLLNNEITVAQVLKQAGYETACFGKWGLGREGTSSTPSRKGFDEWFGYLDHLHAHDYYPSQLWRSSASAGVDDLAMILYKNADGAQGDYSHDLFTKAATNFVRVARFNSFFLYLAYTIPHANNERKEQGMQVPTDEPYSAENWPAPEKGKAAMITRMDRDIGVLLDQLKRQGLDEDTVVFFSSDNGPHRESGVKPEFFQSSGPLRGIKRDLYEGGIRVPMIVRWPGHVPAGATNHQIWAFWDFLPTAAEIAGAKSPSGLDGISMLPALLGQKQTNQHEFLYWEFHETGSSQAVLMGDWKAIRPGPGQSIELYDLKSDPAETNNVASGHTDIVERIEAYLKTARTESEHWPLRTAGAQREATEPTRRGAPGKTP
jgi:arylsulfatase A-like enzyme